jgi:hypothetical protein
MNRPGIIDVQHGILSALTAVFRLSTCELALGIGYN